PGVRAALAVIADIPIDAALLAVRVDDGLSFPVARALEEHAVPYAFVTAVPGMVEAEPGMQGKPLVRKASPRLSRNADWRSVSELLRVSPVISGCRIPVPARLRFYLCFSGDGAH